ncbi:MAG: hypothetical protein N3A02_02810, partial [Rectinema sp.]|nr:hypothetical protein [Rectinema sp.]
MIVFRADAVYASSNKFMDGVLRDNRRTAEPEYMEAAPRDDEIREFGERPPIEYGCGSLERSSRSAKGDFCLLYTSDAAD